MSSRRWCTSGAFEDWPQLWERERECVCVCMRERKSEKEYEHEAYAWVRERKSVWGHAWATCCCVHVYLCECVHGYVCVCECVCMRERKVRKSMSMRPMREWEREKVFEYMLGQRAVVCVYMCVCVHGCVCAWERERERHRDDKKRDISHHYQSQPEKRTEEQILFFPLKTIFHRFLILSGKVSYRKKFSSWGSSKSLSD